jgi:hypothetical protein
MSLAKTSGQKAVEVRFSVLELSAWGFNPRRGVRPHTFYMSRIG